MQITRRTVGTIISGLLVLTLAACGGTQATKAQDSKSAAASITIKHAQGTTTLDALPKKVVVLEYGTLDTLSALGSENLVVGLGQHKSLPAAVNQYAKVPVVGTLQEPDYEKLATIKPDLVIIGYRSAKQYPELTKKYKTIDVTAPKGTNFYDAVAYSTEIIAKAVGKEKEATAELKKLSTVIADAKAKAPDGKNALILMTTGGKVGLQGPASRYRVIHQDLGIAPAIKDIKEASHGDPVSFEAIQKANPDMLFVVDRDAAIGQEGPAAKQVLSNELVASTNAWKNNKVVYLDGTRWYLLIHGVRNAVEMVNSVAKGF